MVESGWVILHLYVLALVGTCIGFDIGGAPLHEDWSWPDSTWDGLAVGFGLPGWDEALPELPATFETGVVHNHYHHYAGGGGPGGPGGPAPHEVMYGPHYQHFPTGLDHHHHNGHHHHHLDPTRDWYCHHAKKAKHLKKWLAKMLFCSLMY